MKKICKSLLLTLLAVAMMLNTCGIVLADTTATLEINEVEVGNGVYKLVFSQTTPAGADGVSATNVVFSYDEEVVQLIDYYDGSETTNVGYALAPLDQGRVELTVSQQSASKNGRTAIAVAVSAPNSTSYDATAGVNFLEFYYKIKDGKSADSETFKLETDTADGSFLATFYPTASNRITAVIDTITINNSLSTPSEQYKYTAGASDTMTFGGWDYTGHDVMVLDHIELSATDETVNVPVKYDADGLIEDAQAATLTLTATAKSAIGTNMDLPADAVWSLLAPVPAGVTISQEGVLSVAPGAEAGTAKVNINSASKGKADTLDIEIVRTETPAPTAFIATDSSNGTIIKPVNAQAPNFTATVMATIYSQYGVLVEDEGGADHNGFVYALTDENGDAKIYTGVSFNVNTITVDSTAEDGKIYVLATHSTYTSLKDIVAIDVCGMRVDWSGVSVSKELTYGEKTEDAFTLPQSGVATVGEDSYNGIFSVVNGDETLNASETPYEVNVVFTVNNDESYGMYKGQTVTSPDTYSVKVNKADYDMSAVAVNGKTVTYDGSAKDIDAPTGLPAGVTVSGKTYFKEGMAAPATEAPSEAGVYTVTVSFAGADTENYNAVADKTATLTINKANTVITVADETPTVTYDGTEKYVEAASLNHNETEPVYEIEGGTYPPTDAGTYTVKISAAETTNYNAKEETVTLTINKARVTKFVVSDSDDTTLNLDSSRTALDANTNGITSLELLGETLYTYAYAAFQGGVELIEDIRWTTEDTWNAKEGVYTFTAIIPENNNLSFEDVTLEAELTIEKVEGTISSDPAIENKTIAKARVIDEGTISVADLEIPTNITISYPTAGDPAADTLNDVTWNKTIDEIKAIAATVTDENEETVELTLADSTFADYEWLTITSGKSLTLTITNKTPATVTLVQDGTTYGTVLPDASTLSWTPSDEGTDAEATIDVTYVGVGDTEYAASTEKPVAAGTYKAVARLVSDIYSGNAEANFTIARKAITYEIAPATKKYSDENPDFEGALAEGSTLADADNALVTEENTVEDILGITFECAADKDTTVGTIDIEGSASNANYDVTVTPNTLTIQPKPLTETDFAPVIGGTVEIGTALTASVAGLANDQYTIQWKVDGEPAEEATTAIYRPVIADSNKVVTVEITGINNYEATVPSEGVTVPKYVISGTITTDITTDNGDDGILNEGDVVAVDITTMDDYSELETAGAEFAIQWKLDDVDIENATDNVITIANGQTGVLSVTVTASGNFDGSITATVGEIGKTPLTGTITLGETEGVVSITNNTVSGTEGTDYDLVWLRGETDITDDVVDGDYTVTAADYGKIITVKAVAKGDTYSGEIVATYNVPAQKPSKPTISTTSTSDSLTVTLTADDNGATIEKFDVTITDGDQYTETVEVIIADGVYTHTFTGLAIGTTYTITATATNSVDTSEEATKTAMVAQRHHSPLPSNKPSTPQPDVSTDDTTTDVTVSIKDTTAKIDNKVLEGKESVAVTTETESGTAVTTTVDIEEAGVAKLAVSTTDSDAAAIGAAAEGAVGTPVEVKVEATDAEGNAADVTVKVAIPSEEKAYAYIIDENGVATRTESVYNEETGKVEVANVPDGAVVMISTTAPATFDDTDAHWAADTINYAVDAGLMNGVGGGAFDPNGNATRGMVNAMLVRLANATGAEIAEASADHKVDTDAAHWAAATDLIALANGWSTGVRTLEDGTVVMDTDATVTREQLVTLLWRFVEHPEAEGDLTTFDDHHETSDWAKDAKAWAVGAGIINGKPGNLLDPNGTATRAEIATMFQRLMNYMTK